MELFSSLCTFDQHLGAQSALLQKCGEKIAFASLATSPNVRYKNSQSVVVKVAVYQRGVAEVGYKTARRLENESKLDEAELACTVNDGIQRSDC